MIGLSLNDFIFKSSDDHFERTKIIELVTKDASAKNNYEYESILYFGDGLWDLKATTELGIDFIGVDFKNNNKLLNARV